MFLAYVYPFLNGHYYLPIKDKLMLDKDKGMLIEDKNILNEHIIFLDKDINILTRINL